MPIFKLIEDLVPASMYTAYEVIQNLKLYDVYIHQTTIHVGQLQTTWNWRMNKSYKLFLKPKAILMD